MKNRLLGLTTAIGSIAAGLALTYSCVSVCKIKVPEGMTVTAHTGCEKTKDNSLDAITLGFGYGADIVEFDLNFDKDGKPVLSHDAPGDKKCVTLDEAFLLVSGYNNLKVNVDVKSTEDLKSVVLCAEKHGISDRIFFTGIEKDKVDIVKEQAPGVVYYLNVAVDNGRKESPEYIDELIEEIKATGACGINLRYTGCTELMVNEFHKNGLLVSVWTVNKKSAMKKMLSLGVDNITTRKIKDLKEMISVAAML